VTKTDHEKGHGQLKQNKHGGWGRKGVDARGLRAVSEGRSALLKNISGARE
jgi:hypothetical protein